MTFNDEQKQAEFEAFAAYFATVSKRPYTAASRSLLSQLRTIGVGQYGNGAFQEVLRENRREAPTQAERLVKPSGGGNRRGQSPGTQNAPPPGSKRAERIEQRKLAQGGRWEAQEVVAAGDWQPVGKTPPSIAEFSEKKAKRIVGSAKTSFKAEIEAQHEKETSVQLSTGATFDTETGRTENSLVQDAVAAELSAKELVEKYGRDLMFEYLIDKLYARDELEQKSDRQLANLLKKEAAK